MAIRRIRPGVFFAPRAELPRGRHALDRDEVRQAQRERLMAAFTELVADQGLSSVTIADVVGHAGVSRAAFYGSFDGLPACADAAYERFISVLLTRLGGAMNPTDDWYAFIQSAVSAYLEALQADPVVARAMQIEMDAAGPSARVRRRHALRQIADLIGVRYAQFRHEDSSIGPLPPEAHLGLVYAVRQLACDALEDDDPDLMPLAEPAIRWAAAAVLGAASAEAGAERGGSTGRGSR